MTPISTTGQYSTAPPRRPRIGPSSRHASEPRSVLDRGATTDSDTDDVDGTGSTRTRPAHIGCPAHPHDRPHLARGHPSPGPTGLGTTSDALREGPPRRGPGSNRGRPGAGGGTGPGALRGPGGGTGSRLGGTHGHGHPTPANNVRTGDGSGEEGHGGDSGRGGGHGGTRRQPLPDDVPALGPTAGRHLPEPAHAPAPMVGTQGPVPPTTGTGRPTTRIATQPAGMRAAWGGTGGRRRHPVQRRAAARPT